MSQANECSHANISCVNQYELIRKYRCNDCGAVMMCECDESFGRRFLAHQLREGVELDTQVRIPVTRGFQPALCNSCRGLPLEAAPGAAIHGRTSKVKRFYWREMFFHETERFCDWKDSNPDASVEESEVARQRIKHEVLEEIKTIHRTAPLYDTREPSQAEMLTRYNVELHSFHPAYAASPEKGAMVILDGKIVSPEAFVIRQYEMQGWMAMPLESVPLHALFAVLTWLLIEHPADPKSRPVAFGSRTAFEAHTPNELIWMHLPEDFGTRGYGRRRKAAIKDHFDTFFKPDGHVDRAHLLELFDYWRAPSEKLRQYLWSHRETDVDRARKIIEILPAETTLAIVRYLVDDYWNRYLGWPDLLLWREEQLLLIEVKSSSDRLSHDQMRWIADNHNKLKLPFRVAKLHRPSRQNGNKKESEGL